MTDRRGFITAGTFCLDRNIVIERWPAEDCVTTVREIGLSGGGSACNFAVDMKRLDPSIPVETQGLVGMDGAGDFLLSVADAHGIDRRGLMRSDAADTQVTDAYQSLASGQRTHMLFVGTAPLLTPDHFDFSATPARFLHLGLPGVHARMDAPWESDDNGWVTTLKRGREAGLETNLELVTADKERTRDLILPCLPHLTTLVINDHEIGALARIETVRDGVTDEPACAAAARAVLDVGAMDLVVVHYPHGATLVARDGDVIRMPSVDMPEDQRNGANGAGDAFCAGFFYGRHQNWDRQACLRLAHATAAACVRRPGTYDAVESADACLALAESWGWRE